MKTSDVTQFLRDMVELTMVFDTDEAGYVIYNKSGERVTLTENNQKCPLLLYQEEINDPTALILNPLAEGLGQTPSSLWFYRVLRISLLGRIQKLWHSILTQTLEEKKLGAKPSAAGRDSHLPMAVMNIASTIIDEVDDKVLDELAKLFSGEDAGELLSIYWQKKHLRTIVRSALFEQDEKGGSPFRAKFPGLRKKTWGILEKLMLGVLHIQHGDEIEKFDRKADNATCVRLSGLLNVLLALYQEINPLLALVKNEAGDADLAIDLSVLAGHINNLTAYADNARYMVQPQRPSTAPPVSVGIPGTTPHVPQPAQAYAPPAANVTLVPGPAYADGRQAPPTPVYNVPGGGVYGGSPYAPPNVPQAYNPGPGGPGFAGYPQPGYVPPGYPQAGYVPPGYQPPPGYIQPQSQYYQPSPQQGGMAPPFNPPYMPNPYPMGGNMAGVSLIPGMPGGIYR